MKDFVEVNELKYHEILENLRRFYLFTSYLSDKAMAIKSDEDIILTLYTNACLNLYSVYQNLKNGLISEAAIIFRSLFENYVNVSLIFEKDVSKRIDLYSNFYYVEVWRQMKRNERLLMRGLIDSIDLKPEFVQLIESKYKSVKDNYHPKNPNHWAWLIFKDRLNRNPNLFDICKYLGKSYEVDYVKIYSTFSSISHSSPIKQNTLKKDNVVTNSPIYNNSIISLGSLAISYCSKTITEIINHIKIKDYEEINEYLALLAFKALFSKGYE